MSAYKSTVKGTVPFDGDVVPFELKRITYAAALELRSKSGPEATDVVKEHVLSLRVNDSEGSPVPMETVFRDFYFAPLIGRLMRELMQTGKIPKEKADPSEGNSPTSSQGEPSQSE